MKHLWIITLIFYSTSTLSNEIRSKIGSTFSEPLINSGKYYFVATTGVLYESDSSFTKANKLYEGKKQTLGSLLIHHDRLYWGDGLHSDQNTTLHIYDLKAKKMIKELSLKGHIERAPFAFGDQIIIPLGPGGILSLDEKTFKTRWQTQKHEEKTLHIDSNIIKEGNELCATTVYDLKGVICFDEKTGKITQFNALKRDPKSEIILSHHQVIGFATDADLVKNKWDIPADLYAFDLSKKKFTFIKELRGFNFFAPAIFKDEAFVTLSTGDFITVSLSDGKIKFLGEFPEPFINNSFIRGSEFCGVGIMGKILCYTRTASGSAISFEKRMLETVIGKISLIDQKFIMPTRTGYAVQ